jgi:hypothetical protein
MNGRVSYRSGWAAAAVLLTLCAGGMDVMAGEAEYLSQGGLDRLVYAHIEWGGLGIDTAIVPPGGTGAPMKIADKTYTRGLGCHAASDIYVDLGGKYEAFEAEIGVQESNHSVGSVVFQVFVDGEKRYDSGVVCDGDAPRPVRVPVAGAGELRLVVNDAGDGIHYDQANWAEARLIPAADGKAEAPPRMNVAAFARLMTWDPDRMEGARALRTQEYRAEDVFLGTEVLRAEDGTIRVPRQEGKAGCIGLEWYESRVVRSISVQLAEGQPMPDPEKVRVEYWKGESAWQGEWTRFAGPVHRAGNEWLSVDVSYAKDMHARGGIQKVRWIFPAGENALVLKDIFAWSATPPASTRLRLECGREQKGEPVELELYNGWFSNGLTRHWDPSGPLEVSIGYSAPRPWKTDRTVLRFRFPDAAFGVAVEDVLESNGVYVPHADLLVMPADSAAPLEEYREKLRGKQTILDEVRSQPEQTFEQAWKAVHNPVQDLGPMMISLACDNRKFVVAREGGITFEPYEAVDQKVPTPNHYRCRIAPQFGDGPAARTTRHLDGEWLPAPVTVTEKQGVVYRQRTCVIPLSKRPIEGADPWLYDRAACVSEFELKGKGADPAKAVLVLAFDADVKSQRQALVKRVDGGLVIVDGDRLMAFVDTRGAGSLEADVSEGTVTFRGELKPDGKAASLDVTIPAWKVSADEYQQVRLNVAPLERLASYWREVMAPAASIELPDPFLASVIRASQVHCLLAARNENQGRQVAAWISADRYGPLESEAQAVIRGMDMWGHDAYARRSLEFFIKRYTQEGFLTTGYTIMGTGWHLWTLAEHFDRTQDQAWLKRIAPEVARVCQWIVDQCAKTRGTDAHGEPVPEHGLFPPAVAADWNRYAYRFVQEGHFHEGLRQAGEMLAAIDHPKAESFVKAADRLREDTLRAYRWSQSRSPVLPLRNGTWVPAYPSMVFCLGRVEDIIPGEDGNRSWCYDVELGAHHLAVLGVLDPHGQETQWMANHMEDVWFLHQGMGDYPEQKNHADPYNLGGFSKVQPYYTRIAEIYALRDEVKPFLRSYFNTIPSQLSREILSFWEHFHNLGGWNKTHETSYFLVQSRLMLVMERGDVLWLAPLVPSKWLEDGKSIVVRDVPTRFGRCGYRIDSHLAEGYVEAQIDSPERDRPSSIVLRLRHPGGAPISRVTVNGKPHESFDGPAGEIQLPADEKRLTVRAEY